ncbi:MAG: hypothetical protein WAN21_08230, partial [Candidatus Sulfotelmatobacter sp.]
MHVRNLKARKQSSEIDLPATSFSNHVSFAHGSAPLTVNHSGRTGIEASWLGRAPFSASTTTGMHSSVARC